MNYTSIEEDLAYCINANSSKYQLSGFTDSGASKAIALAALSQIYPLRNSLKKRFIVYIDIHRCFRQARKCFGPGRLKHEL